MDIHAGFLVTALILIVLALIGMRSGIQSLQSARKMTFYHLRRRREAGAWRWIAISLVLILLGIGLPLFGEPIAYDYFPPSPTASLTPTITVVPTITVSPTITLSPTVTDTPLVTDTPTVTPTPFLPAAILALFQSSVTPNPATVFSPLQFSTSMNNGRAVNPDTVFPNPVGHMYGAFQYNFMAIGSQWSALWVRNGQIVHYETQPWNFAPGGYGFTDWNPPPDQWLPGEYLVQIFVGEDWKVVGSFLVQGNPPTLTPTRIPTSTRTPTSTPTPSETPRPTSTPTATETQPPPSTATLTPPPPASATP